MSVSAFPYGSVAARLQPRATLDGDTLQDISATPTDAEVGYRLTSGGEEQSKEGISASYSKIRDYIDYGVASDFECRLTVNSGTAPSGDLTGTWLACSTTRTWTLTDTSSGGGPITNNCTIEIRDAVTEDLLDSATVTMSVEESV